MATPATEVGAGAGTVGLLETWEATVESDTPHYRESLRAAESSGAATHNKVLTLLSLSAEYLKTVEAQSAARSALHGALTSAAADNGVHADGVSEMLSQVSLIEDKLHEQISNLLVAPLQALVDDPRGLGGCPKLSQAFGSLSHDFYEALAEYLALEGEGSSSAVAAKAHAKTTAKAGIKMGSAAMSQMGSRLGAGFKLGVGAISRSINQHMGGEPSARDEDPETQRSQDPEKFEKPPMPPSPPQLPASQLSGEEDGKDGEGVSSSRGGSRGALHDAQLRVLRQQEGLLKSRHVLESRLIESSDLSSLQLNKALCDFFYTHFSHAHQQVALLSREEEPLRHLQNQTEAAFEPLKHKVALMKRKGARVTELCEFVRCEQMAATGAIPAELVRAAVVPHLSADGDPPPPSSTRKQGVLFTQIGLLRQWKRCWCVAADGVFSIYRLGSSAEGRWREKAIAEISLVLCSVKPVRNGSRCYLSLRTPREHFSLQALTERSMQVWHEHIQMAISAAYGTGGPYGAPYGASSGGAEAAAVRQGEGGAADERPEALEALRALNAPCADCGAKNAEWVSSNLGVLVCLECAGCHRAMGSHVSKMRSLMLDAIDAPLLRALLALQQAALPPAEGVADADARGHLGPNAVWEALVPTTAADAAKHDAHAP